VKKVLSLPLLIVGIGLIALGAYCYNAARDGQQLVRSSLAERHITTPADASIPNATIDGAATAMAMSEWIDGTMDKLTDGRAYQEIPAYLMADGTETNDLSQAARDEFGQPKANPIRQIAFEASTGQTGLGMSIIAIKVGDMAVGLGAVMAVLGLGLVVGALALADLRLGALARRVHLPHARPHHA